jgi:hypothetical protein
MDITEQIAIPGVPRVIGPAQHAVLDYSVAATSSPSVRDT